MLYLFISDQCGLRLIYKILTISNYNDLFRYQIIKLKLLIMKIVTFLWIENYNWSLIWSLKLVTIVLAIKENWLLKINYLNFGYQNDLVYKWLSLYIDL